MQINTFSCLFTRLHRHLLKTVNDLTAAKVELPGGTLSTYSYRRRGQSKKLSDNSKISLQPHCNPKILAHFILRNLCMNIKYSETMQIEIRIASSEPKNFSSTMFGVKKYHEHNFSFIWTQKYHCWNYSDRKNIGLTSPYVHVLSAP